MGIMENNSSLFNRLISQYDEISEMMAYSEDVSKIVKTMNNEITIHFPIKMDDGDIRIFTGYRIQHNNVLGPYKGGFRNHPNLGLDELRMLAFLRTVKSSLVNIPAGGSMGGIRMHPAEYSYPELERITRRYTYSLSSNIGPEYDVMEADISSDAQFMAWIYDTYLTTMPPQIRNRLTHIVTGKPLKLGGTRGSDKATGQGIVDCIEAWAKLRKIDLKKCSFKVQGFGPGGFWTSQLMKAKGAKLVALSDQSGAIYNPRGIDLDGLAAFVNDADHISGYPKADEIDHESFLKTGADILIVTAPENQITPANVELLDVKLLAEGSDFVTDPLCDDYLQEKGIDILPDILCSTGSLIVNYFEWLQNKRSESWELEEVNAKLNRILIHAFTKIVTASEEFGVSWRKAAYIVAFSHLEKVYKERGIFP